MQSGKAAVAERRTARAHAFGHLSKQVARREVNKKPQEDEMEQLKTDGAEKPCKPVCEAEEKADAGNEAMVKDAMMKAKETIVAAKLLDLIK